MKTEELLKQYNFIKIDNTGLASDIFDGIPASLSGNASRYVITNARNDGRQDQVRKVLPDMLILIYLIWCASFRYPYGFCLTIFL